VVLCLDSCLLQVNHIFRSGHGALFKIFLCYVLYVVARVMVVGINIEVHEICNLYKHVVILCELPLGMLTSRFFN
jgi:hypothetical protein